MYLVNIKPFITLPWWKIFRLVLTCRLAFSYKRLIEECYQRIKLLPEKIFQRDSQLLIYWVFGMIVLRLYSILGNWNR